MIARYPHQQKNGRRRKIQRFKWEHGILIRKKFRRKIPKNTKIWMRAWYPHQGKILREKIQNYKYLNESMVSLPGKNLKKKITKIQIFRWGHGILTREKSSEREKKKDLNESMVSPQGEIILEIKNNKTEIWMRAWYPHQKLSEGAGGLGVAGQVTANMPLQEYTCHTHEIQM